MKNNEKGFILITALVLLSIITLLGTTAAFKAVIETKVSRMSGAGAQAFMVANAGLQKQYIEWGLDSSTTSTDGDQSEFGKLLDDVENMTTTSGIYNISVTPSSIDDLRSNHANSNIDTWVQGDANVRVFELTASGMTIVANSTWNGANKQGVQQVAVWATSFISPVDGAAYPYLAPNAAACTECSLVVYALGRFDQSYRMARQTMSKTSAGKLQGVSAMTNAPSGANFNEICAGGAVTVASSNVTPWDPTVTGGGGNGSAVIEATQAPYLLGKVPSGTALASNTALGTGGKGFRGGTGSETGGSFESTPYVVYSGHGTATGMKVDWADAKHDITVPAADLPTGLLPTKLMNAPLMNTDDQVTYFSDKAAQLFSMDSYRWAAEQFTCQDPAKGDGVDGNGIYCSKGDTLRRNLASYLGYTPVAPVTGRLTIAQFEYNIANSIPMFGIVRIMFPAETMGGGCGSLSLHQINMSLTNGENVAKITATTGGAYDGGTANAILDKDGDLGPTARIMVYGTLLVDYFKDDAGGGGDNNALYDADDKEWLLSPIESPDVYLAIAHNIMINPAMPLLNGGEPRAFPTAAAAAAPSATPATAPSRLSNAAAVRAAADNGLTTAGKMNMVDINDGTHAAKGNRVNLASPYDGYFPWAEGLIAPASDAASAEGPAGTMRLMSLTAGKGLVDAMQRIEAGVQPATIPTQKMKDMLLWAKPQRLVNVPNTDAGTEADVLKYYYNLLKKSTDYTGGTKTPDANVWPIAAWPGNDLSGNFYIGKEDAVNLNNDGDKTHLMFPSGYVHAWKVALAALDVTADEWNNILSGGVRYAGIADTGGLASDLAGDCGGAVAADCVAGKPFGPLDTGFTNVTTIQGNEKKYFGVTEDATTGYGLLDADWKDIPSTMYSGGLLDMHAHSNMNGIVYTPGPLEWEPGNSNYDSAGGGVPVCKKWKKGKCKKWKKPKKSNGPHISYVNGAVITGYGSYTKNKTANDRYVMVFDPLAVDNVSVESGKGTIVLRRYAWQGLR